MYRGNYSEFEVHALAYGILRKNLYPKYLVRGEYYFGKAHGFTSRGSRPDIAIFKAIPNGDPQLVLTVEIKKSGASATKQGLRYEKLLGVPCVYVRGIIKAYDVLEVVRPYLENS